MARANDYNFELFRELHCQGAEGTPAKISVAASSFILATWRTW